MAKLKNFLLRPRYLRAIPSLMLLTTAMAWGVASEADRVDAMSKKAGLTLTHSAGGSAGGGRGAAGPQGKVR